MKTHQISAFFFILFVVFSATPAESQTKNFPPGKVRTYYIAADEISWDYAPNGRNMAGLPTSASDEGGEGKLQKYLKAVYREYTDATFKTLAPRPPQWEHLGILGPVIRAEVGDTVKVVFKNNTKIICSMHPHGLEYAKDSEGALYRDGVPANEKKGDVVAPGDMFTYVWSVPERAGPAPGDTSSILWVYHSHIIESRDMNSGLFGPIIVSARGTTKPDGTPKDVDREFIVAFAVFDETQSWFFEANEMQRRKYDPNLKYSDPTFRKLHTFYTMNGLIEGNMPLMTMKKGERVRWYLFANTNDDDVHTPHWHGQTVIVNNMRTDMVNLAPMMMMEADMVPDAVGTWLFHCHIGEHMEGGMMALYKVTP